MSEKCNNSARRQRRLDRILIFALSLCIGIFLLNPARAAEPVIPPSEPTVTYARISDLVILSPAIARVTITSATPLKPERAPDVGAGNARFYVESKTSGLIRGDTVIARRIAFLLDGPADKKSRASLKRRTLLIFGKVSAQVDQFQLTSSTALIDATAANEALVRKVLGDYLAPDLPPAIKGVSSAFYVAGAILGEGETQVFLETTNGTPISLSIVRRPDEQPLFSASLGEIVDNSASFPKPDTMLWYRLACGLPAALPARALRGLEQADAEQASRDYLAFRQALAPCNREPGTIF